MDPAAAMAGFADPLEDPRARAALLQFGLTLLSPNYGNTPAGALAQAVGSAGEAVKRADDQDVKAQLTESKLAVDNAKIASAEDRANSAAERNRLTGESLGLRELIANQSAKLRETDIDRKRQESESKLLQRRGEIEGKQRKDLSQAAEKEADRILKEISAEDEKKSTYAQDAKLFKPGSRLAPEPVKTDPNLDRFRGKTRQEIAADLANDPSWFQGYTGARGYGQPTTPSQPPATVQPLSGQSGTVETSGNVTYPTAPVNPKMRTPGQVYNTPKGPLEWTGSTWLPPSTKPQQTQFGL